MRAEGLIRDYEIDREVQPLPGVRCRAISLRHDGAGTFGFRFEAAHGLFGQTLALAYATDLGSWSPALAEALADVDLLALEFNHDVAMQHASGRSPFLIQRILGERGHLSNEQAAALVGEVLRLSPGRLQHLVQLHLSQDCNRPDLAQEAARAAIAAASGVTVHTAERHRPLRTIWLGPRRRASLPRQQLTFRRRAGGSAAPLAVSAWLPGFEP